MEGDSSLAKKMDNGLTTLSVMVKENIFDCDINFSGIAFDSDRTLPPLIPGVVLDVSGNKFVIKDGPLSHFGNRTLRPHKMRRGSVYQR